MQLHVAWLKTVLPVSDARTPCANTYRYICSHLDVDELNQILGRFFAQANEAIATGEESKQRIQAACLPAEQRGQEHLSLDGKCLRGTCESGDAPATSGCHVLALYNITHGHVLRQISTAGPGDEQPAGVDLLHGLGCATVSLRLMPYIRGLCSAAKSSPKAGLSADRQRESTKPA